MAWTEETRRKAIEAKKLRGNTNQYTKASAQNKKIVSPLKGRPNTKWKPHSEETKSILRKKALNSSHRRIIRSTRYYTKKNGEIILLDSSWEEKLAHRLDALNIEWCRPDPILWIDKSGTTRNYFPDFYLPKYDLYLDPKNPAVMFQQSEKIEWLREHIQNLIFLKSINEIETFCPCS